MESPRRVNEPFPEADVVGELHPETAKNFTVDPVSSDVAKSKELKEEARKKEEIRKEQEKKDAAHKLKSTIIISGVVVAVVGAIFALTKKLRERHD